jgi:hypothetical protein
VPPLTKISLCLTQVEAEAIEACRHRLARAGILLNQSETVRTAIALMANVDEAALVQAAKITSHLKPGRKSIRAITPDPSHES